MALKINKNKYINITIINTKYKIIKIMKIITN